VPPAVAQAGLSAGIPYGGKPVNQLDKAFRPSGRGKPFPLPAIVDGRPVGPWWFLRVPGGGSNLFSGGVSLSTYVFFPDGTAAALFRPGGPQLADLESMHALGEDDYIGRFSVAGGVMNIAFGPDDRNLLSKPITVKQSGGTPYFLWWQREYQPALPVPRDFLLGTWRSGAMGTMSFRADGTVATTKNMVDTDWGSTVPVTGTWALDGYLFAMHFPGYGDRVYSLFRTASGSIVLNQSMMSRE